MLCFILSSSFCVTSVINLIVFSSIIWLSIKVNTFFYEFSKINIKVFPFLPIYAIIVTVNIKGGISHVANLVNHCRCLSNH